MNPRTLFDSLLYAEHENEVTAILRKAGYDSDDPDTWAPLGQVENNFGTVGVSDLQESRRRLQLPPRCRAYRSFLFFLLLHHHHHDVGGSVANGS